MNSLHQPQPPLQANRLSDQVAAQIQALVVKNAMKPGEKLPSERELCEMLGVSRAVVHEAVQSLVAKGLLEVRRDGDPTPRAPDPTLVSELLAVMLRSDASGVSFSHAQEARRLLEVESAGLAAERRSDDDLARIAAQIEAMQAREDQPRHWAEADLAFHAAIAAASHNPLYPVLLGAIAGMLMEVRLAGASLPDIPHKARRHHQIIFERIAARDCPGARAAMQEHLRDSEETLLKAGLTKLGE